MEADKFYINYVIRVIIHRFVRHELYTYMKGETAKHGCVNAAPL